MPITVDYSYTENRCRLCKKVLCCISCRQKHENEVHEVFPECDICVYGCVVLRAPTPKVLEHIQSAHWPLNCVRCRRVFNTLEDIKMHTKCPGICIKCPDNQQSAEQVESPIILTLSKDENFESPPIPLNRTAPAGENFFNICNTNVVTSTPLCSAAKEKLPETPNDSTHANIKRLKSNIKSANTSDSKKRKVTFCNSLTVVTLCDTPMVRNYRKSNSTDLDVSPATFSLMVSDEDSNQFHTAKESWDNEKSTLASSETKMVEDKIDEPLKIYQNETNNVSYDNYNTPERNIQNDENSKEINSVTESSNSKKMDEICEQDENEENEYENEINTPKNNEHLENAKIKELPQSSQIELHKSFESPKSEAYDDVKLELNKLVWESPSSVQNDEISPNNLIIHENKNTCNHDDIAGEIENTLWMSATDLDLSNTTYDIEINPENRNITQQGVNIESNTLASSCNITSNRNDMSTEEKKIVPIKTNNDPSLFDITSSTNKIKEVMIPTETNNDLSIYIITSNTSDISTKEDMILIETNNDALTRNITRNTNDIAREGDVINIESNSDELTITTTTNNICSEELTNNCGNINLIQEDLVITSTTKDENSKADCNESNLYDSKTNNDLCINEQDTANMYEHDDSNAKNDFDNIFTSTKCSMTNVENISPNDIVVYSRIHDNDEENASCSNKTSAFGLWSSVSSIVKCVMGLGPNSIVNSSESSTSNKRLSEDNVDDPCRYKKRMKLIDIKCRRTIRDICPLPHFPFKIMIDKCTQTEDI